MSKKKIVYIVLLILFIAQIVFIIMTVTNSQKTQAETDKINNSINKLSETEGNIATITDEENYNVTADMDHVIDIKEKMFIQQISDIEINAKEYEGTTVRLQGFMYNYYDAIDGNTYHYVLRNTPGCCGNDGQAGFEIRGNIDFPEDDEWVEATGVIKLVTDDYYTNFPVLYITNLEVMEERGADFVTQ